MMMIPSRGGRPARWRSFALVAGRFAQFQTPAVSQAVPVGCCWGRARTSGAVTSKRSCTIAEEAGDLSPDGMQPLLDFYAWSADTVRDDPAWLRAGPGLGRPAAVGGGRRGRFPRRRDLLGRCAAALLRTRLDQDCSARVVLGLRVAAWAGVDRPGAVPADVPGPTIGNAAPRPGSAACVDFPPEPKLAQHMLDDCWPGTPASGSVKFHRWNRPTATTPDCGPGWNSRTSTT